MNTSTVDAKAVFIDTGVFMAREAQNSIRIPPKKRATGFEPG